MDDEMLSDLLAAAILKSACALAQCRVSAEVHRWHFDVVHLDDSHVCPVHPTGEYPSRVISIYTVLTTPRESLVQTLGAWLSHLHSCSTESNPQALHGLDVGPEAALDDGVDVAFTNPIAKS